MFGEALAHARLPVSVAALGGYGRQAQCLHSDVDLLILFAGTEVTAAEEQFAKAMLVPLWDLRLVVGHQVRVLADFDRVERDNPEFLLAWSDARWLAGDGALFEAARSRVRQWSGGWRHELRDALLRLTDARHARFDGTVYQLEPDIKDAPGGLRDVTAVRLLLSSAEDQDEAALIDEVRLDQAEEFLMRVRSVLHLVSGRNMNVLNHDLQERTAEHLHFAAAEPQRRVEAFMGEYFRHARAVARALAQARRLADHPRPRTIATAVGPNLVLTADGIGFAEESQAALEPATWLTAVEAALERRAALSDATLRLFERHGARCTVWDLLPAPEDRQRLLRLLVPRPGLSARLADLHDCGLLERLFPEMQAITCRVIRDFYHKYTVDEHTLKAIRGLERLLRPESPSRERFAAVLGELRAPETVVIALLYHDVGKGREEHHAEESVRLVQPMLDRLGIAREIRQDVTFLIAQHLQMSRVAFYRDCEDPAVVRQFAALVGTEERLKMLCLMTLVDIEAVGADTLTPWKEELLWRLYVDTYNHLTLGYADDLIAGGLSAVAALQATRPPDLGEDELARFLEGLPQRYLATFDADQVYRHARLARNIRPDEVHLFLQPKGDLWELTVVTLDKPRLFSDICGVLAYFGMDIVRGGAMTSPAGLVLDIVQFADQEGFFRLNPGASASFEDTLRDVVAGRADAAAMVRRKDSGLLRRRVPRRVSPVIRFDTEHSQRYTVLEIVAQDEIGLLHLLGRAISRQGCDVDLVLIATEGQRAIDVFHLTLAGSKLPDAVQMALRDDLQRTLEDSHETH